jgi:RHS repeat-associated protein
VTDHAYDANGNTLSDPSGKSYSWDFENRLTQAVNPVVGTTTFKYDPFGRRIYKSSPTFAGIFLYDNDNLIETVNPSGTMLARYSQGINIDEHLSEFRSSEASYYEQDGLESVSSLSVAAGTLANTYNYDSFGNLIASTGTLTNPFQYTGRDYDTETGLRYYRARYYDPAQGRFLSEDPARFSGGFDFYGYVKNDPVDFMDPTGLQCEQVSPWTEIPSLYGPNGPSPYLTIQDGVNWVSAGFSIYGIGFIECRCKWVATHTRIRKFYRVTTTEQAEFKCGCPPTTEYRTRERTKEYEIDSPGPWIMPGQMEYTYGNTFQLENNVGLHPKNWPGSVSCSCLTSPPTP